MNIAKQAELESAAAEGSLVTLSLTSGESMQVIVTAFSFGMRLAILKKLSANWLVNFLAKSEHEWYIIP